MDNKNIIFLLALIALVFIVSFGIFGLTGLRVMLLFFVIPIPFFLILSRFEMDIDEKIIFSVFISMIAFPLLVWYMNMFIIPSFTVTIFIVFFILLGIGFITKRKRFK